MFMCIVSLSCVQANREAMGPAPLSSAGQTHAFSVRSLQDSVVWEDHAVYRSFSVTVRFQNSGPQPLYKHWCATAVQRLVESAWVTVQNVICVEGYPEYVAVAAGESASQKVSVYRYPDPRHLYGDSRLVAGVYRLVFPLGFDYSNGSGLLVVAPDSLRSTQPFVVRDP